MSTFQVNAWSGKTRTNPPRVSLIVVNYNGLRKLGKIFNLFMATLLRTDYENMEIIFVDNASSDNSTEYIAKKFNDPRLRIVRLKRNVGYAGAVEIARRHATGEIIGVLNNDLIFVDKFWLRKIVNMLLQNPNIDVISPLLIRPDMKMIDSVGGSMNALMVAWDNLSGRDVGEFKRALQKVMPQALKRGYVYAALPPGAAFFLRSALVKIIGGYIFDKDFFAYYEDVELGLRLQLRQLKVAIALNAPVIHVRGASWGRISLHKFYFLRRNSIMILIKFLPLEALITMLPLYFVSSFYAAYVYKKITNNSRLITYTFKIIKDIIINFRKLYTKRKTLMYVLGYSDEKQYGKAVTNKIRIVPIMPWYSSSLSLISKIAIILVNLILRISHLPNIWTIKYSLKYSTLSDEN